MLENPGERAHKLELISVATVQFIAHLCSLKLFQPADIEFESAIKALYETWDNYLLLLYEICNRLSITDNVIYLLF